MKNLKLLYLDFNLPYLLKDADYPVGGATVEWFAWIKGLIQNNCQVGVLTWKGSKEYINKLIEFDIVETYDLNDGIPKLRWIYKRYPSLVKAIRAYNPDYLIQECAGYATGIMAHIGNKLNIPFIYRVANDMEVDERLKGRLSYLKRNVYKFGLNKAKYILAQNNFQYNILKKHYPHSKVVKMYNPYYYSKNLPKIKSNKFRKYIAWIGIFQYQKNLPALLRIVQNNLNIEFNIAGKSGKKIDEGTKIALERLKKCKNVKFVGYLNRSEILPFLGKAYALLNTSYYEGFSNTFLEAFAVGTPVITLGINPDEIISKYNLGFVTNENEINLIFNRLKINYDYIKSGQKIRKYLDSKHNYRNVAASLLKILENCKD